MNEDKKKYTSEDDIEKLLAPRCEFYISAGFKEKLMQEANSIPKKNSRRWIPLAVSLTAAASVAIIIFTALYFYLHESKEDMPVIVATESTVTPSDTVSVKNSPALYANAQEQKNEAPVTINPQSQHRTAQVKTQQRHEQPIEAQNMTITEGEMPMISKDDSMDPEEVRLRLLETRRNAEIAYIDRMRDEIEANQAYIEQLMTLGNVSE